jgi:hypothetical protein
LAISPLLILGFIHLRQIFSASTYFKIIIGFLILGQFYITFNYMLISLVNVYEYPINPIAQGDIFNVAISLYAKKMLHNISLFKINFLQIFIFSTLISSIIFFSKQKLNFDKKLKLVLLGSIIAYLGMSISNIIVGPENVNKLKQQGFFADKVIGSGEEIYLIDYVLDMTKTISSRGNKIVNTQILDRVGVFYERVERQIVQSVPEFDEAVKNKSLDFSFFISSEKLREKNAYEASPLNIKNQ